LKSAGEASGIDFTGLTDRAPNSTQAHTLLKYYESNPTVQNNLMEVIFRHYFTDGKYPDSNNLRDALEEVSAPNMDEAMEYSMSNEHRSQVREEALNYSASGISGVPFFYFNGKPAFSGAQPPTSMLRAILNGSQ
jgi:predicted DsbA family dithiol-disulfide isomerase